MVTCVQALCFRLPERVWQFFSFSSIFKTIARIVQAAFLYFTNQHSPTISPRQGHVTAQVRNIESWIKKYRSAFVERFDQGSADVCYALCFRLAAGMLKNPQSLLRQNKIGRILPEDRFLQAATLIDFDLFQSLGDLPNTYLKKRGFRERQLFTAVETSSMTQTLVNRILALQPQNAVLILHRARHTTFIRFDTEHERFCFFDPNFGTIAFSPRPYETDQSLAVRMVKCWSDLYAVEYDRARKSPLVCNQLEEIS